MMSFEAALIDVGFFASSVTAAWPRLRACSATFAAFVPRILVSFSTLPCSVSQDTLCRAWANKRVRARVRWTRSAVSLHHKHSPG